MSARRAWQLQARKEAGGRHADGLAFRHACAKKGTDLADAAVLRLQNGGDHGALEAGRVGRHRL